MKFPLICAALIVCSTPALAQQPTKEDIEREAKLQSEASKGKDTTHQGWKLGSVAGVNLSQVAFKDWSQGGDNSLAFQLWGQGSAVHLADQTRWINNLKLTFGQARIGDQEMRKTDDEIHFESLLIYLLGTTINPYGSFTLRTQIAPGYVYPKDLQQRQISAFFDPAYLTQSIGVAYTPTEVLTVRLGAGLREILTSNYNRYADDPATPLTIEKTRVLGGMESVTDVKWPFAENMVLISKLELFAPFNQLDRVFVRNDNTISAQVNKYVTVNLNVQLVNDADVSPRTQMKQALALGLSYTLL